MWENSSIFYTNSYLSLQDDLFLSNLSAKGFNYFRLSQNDHHNSPLWDIYPKKEILYVPSMHSHVLQDEEHFSLRRHIRNIIVLQKQSGEKENVVRTFWKANESNLRKTFGWILLVRFLFVQGLETWSRIHLFSLLFAWEDESCNCTWRFTQFKHQTEQKKSPKILPYTILMIKGECIVFWQGQMHGLAPTRTHWWTALAVSRQLRKIFHLAPLNLQLKKPEEARKGPPTLASEQPANFRPL